MAYNSIALPTMKLDDHLEMDLDDIVNESQLIAKYSETEDDISSNESIELKMLTPSPNKRNPATMLKAFSENGHSQLTRKFDEIDTKKESKKLNFCIEKPLGDATPLKEISAVPQIKKVKLKEVSIQKQSFKTGNKKKAISNKSSAKVTFTSTTTQPTKLIESKTSNSSKAVIRPRANSNAVFSKTSDLQEKGRKFKAISKQERDLLMQGLLDEVRGKVDAFGKKSIPKVQKSKPKETGFNKSAVNFRSSLNEGKKSYSSRDQQTKYPKKSIIDTNSQKKIVVKHEALSTETGADQNKRKTFGKGYLLNRYENKF